MTISRMTGPRGPRFYEENGSTLFVLALDGNTRFGPFPATDQNAADHPEAYRQYLTEKAAESRGESPNDFPGRPLITVMDPPEGRPAPRARKPRGRASQESAA